MPETELTVLDRVRAAACQAITECIENRGMKTVVPVKELPHQVRAYRIGQNLLRLDIVFDLQSDWSPTAECTRRLDGQIQIGKSQ